VEITTEREVLQVVGRKQKDAQQRTFLHVGWQRLARPDDVLIFLI